MKPHRILLLAAGIGTVALCTAQQLPITTQYLFNGLLINPAYAGSRKALTANLTWRQQWAGFEGAPRTQVLSIHSPLPEKKLALGLLLINDRIGVAHETAVTSNYAYRIRLGRGQLAFGLGAGVRMQAYEWTAVRTTDPGDARFLADGTDRARPDFSAGLYWADKKWFAGLSLPTLPRGGTLGDSLAQGGLLQGSQPMLTAGTVVRANPDIKLKPSLLLRKADGAPLQADLNLNLIWRERLWVGVSWRSSDEACLLLEVLPTPQLRIGYAYDLTMGPLASYHQGSHEVMLQYEFGFHVKARDPRYF
jgi:type IX secretion system PorP/SprF family membrane protein